jgi:hypothetical protein
MQVDNDKIIEFFVAPVQDQAATLEQGRPIFRDTEMIRIAFVGDHGRTVIARAHEECFFVAKDRHLQNLAHRAGKDGGFLTYAERFPDHYESFKRKAQNLQSGTPLMMLAFLTQSRVAEYAALNVKTVEHLLAMPESGIERAGPGTRRDIEMAKAWMDRAAQANAVARAEAEKGALEDRLRAMELRLAAAEAGPRAEGDLGLPQAVRAADLREGAEPETMDDDALRAELVAAGITVRSNAARDKLIEAVRSMRADMAA